LAGWLTITEEQLAHIDALKQIAADVKKARFKHALLLGRAAPAFALKSCA